MTDEMWTVEVDRSACLGSGVCASVAPRHFAIDNGRSRPRAARSEPVDELRDAVVLCPAAAVLVRDGAGEIVE